MPDRLDLGHLGEEAVPADVEAPAVAFDGAADAADDVVGLEDDDVGDVVADELERSGEPGGTRTDDDHGR